MRTQGTTLPPPSADSFPGVTQSHWAQGRPERNRLPPNPPHWGVLIMPRGSHQFCGDPTSKNAPSRSPMQLKRSHWMAGPGLAYLQGKSSLPSRASPMLAAHLDHLGCLKICVCVCVFLDLTLRISNTVSLEWILRICIFKKAPRYFWCSRWPWQQSLNECCRKLEITVSASLQVETSGPGEAAQFVAGHCGSHHELLFKVPLFKVPYRFCTAFKWWSWVWRHASVLTPSLVQEMPLPANFHHYHPSAIKYIWLLTFWSPRPPLLPDGI